MRKFKFLSILICLLCAITTRAQTISFTVNGIRYRGIETKSTCYVCFNSDRAYFGDIIIPEEVTYDGVTFLVIGIESMASPDLNSVILPNSITWIGSHAFDGCHNLSRINIPNSVTEIGSQAFMGCFSLTDIVIPEKITMIRDECNHRRVCRKNRDKSF